MQFVTQCTVYGVVAVHFQSISRTHGVSFPTMVFNIWRTITSMIRHVFILIKRIRFIASSIFSYLFLLLCEFRSVLANNKVTITIIFDKINVTLHQTLHLVFFYKQRIKLHTELLPLHPLKLYILIVKGDDRVGDWQYM